MSDLQWNMFHLEINYSTKDMGKGSSTPYFWTNQNLLGKKEHSSPIKIHNDFKITEGGKTSGEKTHRNTMPFKDNDRILLFIYLCRQW